VNDLLRPTRGSRSRFRYKRYGEFGDGGERLVAAIKVSSDVRSDGGQQFSEVSIADWGRFLHYRVRNWQTMPHRWR
jgi:hypothetical protein